MYSPPPMAYKNRKGMHITIPWSHCYYNIYICLYIQQAQNNVIAVNISLPHYAFLKNAHYSFSQLNLV